MTIQTALFANNTVSALAAPIGPSATSFSVAPGGGNQFPSPGANQFFAVTLTDAATGLINEICYCTARTGDVLTVTRAQEGTTALSWLAGDYVRNLITAGVLAKFGQTT